MRQLRPHLDGVEPRHSRPTDARPGNLPLQLTSFVGRKAESAAIRSLLARSHLVTVTGAGGSGKTRLVAHVAAGEIDEIERWPDGVWWVDLQTVTKPTDSSAVAAAVADAVGVLVEPGGGPLRSLTAQLRDRRALLCLDNCEHVVDAVAELVHTLVTACPEVSMLATSREALNDAEEATWRLPAMEESEAIELFVERAQQVQPSFTVDDDSRPVLQRLCRGLDGIPLAIELAAAWVSSLSPQEIEAGLDDRFSLLVRGSPGTAARHQTLEASIDWSHQLLDPTERTLLRRLSVFSGGFGLDAARVVCAGHDLPLAAVLPALDGLVDKSLVAVDDSGGVSRFRLLETIRQYARRRLDQAGEQSTTSDRHLDHLLAVAEDAEPLLDHDKDRWLTVVEPERENLRAALDWGLSADDPDPGRRLAAATAWLWNLHGRGPEGLAILRRAMERAPEARTPLQARLMLGFALVGDTAAPGDLDPVHEGEVLTAELGDERLHGRFLTLAAVGAFANHSDLDTAWQLCDEALHLADATADGRGRDMALALQGLVLHLRDQHDAARAVLAPVTDRLIDCGERGIASTILVFQSDTALYTAEVALAHQLARRAAEIADPLGDYHRVGITRSQLALLRGVAGDIDGGLEMLQELVRIVDDAGPGVVVPGMARTLGLLHLWRGDLDDSVRWLGPSALPGDPQQVGPGGPVAMPGLAEALRHQGNNTDAAAVLDRAETLARPTGMARVLADVLDQQAHLAAADNPARGFDLHHEALQLRLDHGLRTFQITSLEALAGLMARTGRAVDDATRVLATSARARDTVGLPRRPIDEADHAATLANLRSRLGDDAYDQAWHDGCGLTLDDAVALVRRSRGRRGRRPSTGWDSLTPTELEVVTLVADGLSNPEIAAKLFMSRATVKTHLIHIFTKLQVSNRTELATLALRVTGR